MALPLTSLAPRVYRAAITGKVRDTVVNQRLAGVHVTITAMPIAFQNWLSIRALEHGDTWGKMVERPDRSVTRGDGTFRFVDLPGGAYTLSCAIPGGSRRYGTAQKNVTVTPAADGSIPLDVQLINLPPTAIRGTIKGGPAPPKLLPMARIRVRGSGEVAYGDPSGVFYLTNVEVGLRTLEIRASGYQTMTTTAAVVEGQITELGSFVLTPTT